MRDYGKVHTSFWASDTLRDLDDEAKLLALYLLTCTHSNMAGAFRLPDGYVAEDLGWTPERFRNGLETLSASGFLSYCTRTKFVWIVKFLAWNKPENPNQWKAVAKFMAAIPKACTFFDQANERVPEPFRNSPVPVPVPTPVPEKKPRKAIKVPLPADFALSERVTRWAGEKGHSRLPERFEHFVSAAKAKGYEYADWDEALMAAIRDDWAKFGKPNAPAKRRAQL